jgi:hypothetical protein
MLPLYDFTGFCNKWALVNKMKEPFTKKSSITTNCKGEGEGE